jgi:hypothetical protein
MNRRRRSVLSPIRPRATAVAGATLATAVDGAVVPKVVGFASVVGTSCAGHGFCTGSGLD